MRVIRYHGSAVAMAGPHYVTLLEPIADLPPGHPHRRFVAAMLLYSREIDQRRLPGPYTDQDAERYARLLLIPAKALALWPCLPDRHIARRLGLPAQQVRLRRRQLSGSPPPRLEREMTACGPTSRRRGCRGP